MKAELFFQLKLPYVRTEYAPLNELCASRVYDPVDKVYVWVFRVSDLERVTSILGKPVELSGDDQGFVAAYGKRERIEMEVDGGKGKGYTKILLRSPELFIVEIVKNKAPFKISVPTETIVVIWSIILSYSTKMSVKVTTIQQRYCEYLGITRFNRESGSFDPKSFYGDRKSYFKFYGALKILQEDGCIDYLKVGEVRRISDAWKV